MPNLTRDEILARKTGRGTATLPDGSTVDIRALTRNEVLEMQESGRSLAERDNFIVAKGMTDPELSEADVAAWADNGGAGDLVAITEAIAVLSGLQQGAGKSGVAGA